MPSHLALLLCTVFVFVLLRYDARDPHQASAILWLPTVWMLSVATKPLAVWFPAIGGSTESSLLDRTFLVALLLLGVFVLSRKQLDFSRSFRKQLCVVALLGYMLISVSWSDMPFTSFKRWARELVAFIMALVLLTERDPRQAVICIIRRTVYVLIPFSLLLVKYYRDYGVEFGRWSGHISWIGVTTQKNGLGRLCLISTFFLVWTFIRRHQHRAPPVGKYEIHAEALLLVITLYLMRGPPGAFSATSFLATIVGLAVLMGLLWFRKRGIRVSANVLTVILAIGIGYGVLAFMTGGGSLGGVASGMGRDETLTGRTQVWAELVPVAMQHALVGCGFGGFWTAATKECYRISGAHSGYLDVLLELGFLGLIVVSLFLLSSCRKAQRELGRSFDWASLWICFLVMAIAHNITESSINTLASHLMAILLFLAVASTANASDTPVVSRGST